MRRFVVTKQDAAPPKYRESEEVSALKVCFNSGWVFFYGTFDRLILALPSWQVISVVEMEN